MSARDVVRCGITLFGEGDLGAFLPATLDDNMQDLVLGAHSSPIRVERRLVIFMRLVEPW